MRAVGYYIHIYRESHVSSLTCTLPNSNSTQLFVDKRKTKHVTMSMGGIEHDHNEAFSGRVALIEQQGDGIRYKHTPDATT